MPSPPGSFLRTGSRRGEGSVRHRPHRHPVSPGRAPADHPHAVGSGPLCIFTAAPRDGTALRTGLILRETNFGTGELGPESGIQEIYAVLAANEDRNMLIFDDVLKSLDEGRSPILLTERKDHLDHLAERFRKYTRHLVVLKGGMGARERREVMERLGSIPSNEERLGLATRRDIGEGFEDAPPASTHCSSLFPSPVKGPLSSMRDVCTASVPKRKRYGSTTTWTGTSRSW